MTAPEQIHCRLDTNLTDTGEFLGTCWRNADEHTVPYSLNCPLVTQKIQALTVAAAQMQHALFVWDAAHRTGKNEPLVVAFEFGVRAIVAGSAALANLKGSDA